MAVLKQNPNRQKCHAQMSAFRDSVYLFGLWYDLTERKTYQVMPDRVEIPEGVMFSGLNPTMILNLEDATELMNQLWAAGIRPEQSKGSAGQLEATQYHLEDMRRIAFGGTDEN